MVDDARPDWGNALARLERRWSSAPGGLRLLALAVLISLAVMRRNPGLFFHPQLHSEDLFVFFNEDRLFGVGAFMEPYAGYYQFGSRIIAFLAGFAPLEDVPAVYAALFIAAVLGASLLIYTSPAFSGWGKVLAALTIVASPAGSEVFLGMCYTLWIFAPAAALALYERPTSAGRSALLIGFFVVTGLSSSFTVIATPLVLVKLVTDRSRHAAALAIATAVVACVQLPGMLSRAAATATSGSPIERLLQAKSVLYTWLTGAGYPGYPVPAILSLIMLALMIRYLWHNRSVCWRASVYLAGFGAAILLAGCLALPPILHWNAFTHGARYFYPAAALSMLALIAIEQQTPRWRSTLPVIAAVMALNFAFRAGPPVELINETYWPATVACLRSSTNCVSVMNPPIAGATRVPSDRDLKTMTYAKALEFRENQRLPRP
jgi:hypothetical protein